MSHTPGDTPAPWHLGAHYRGIVESADGRICECRPFNSERAAANAAFIIRAVNAHDELVEACNAAIDFLEAAVPYGPDAPVFTQLARAVKKASATA